MILSALALCPVATVAEGSASVFVVVVSPDVPVSSMSFDDLHRIFLFREQYWKQGHPVRVLFSEDALEPGSLLLERIYRMDFASLRRMILEKLYQGEINMAPKVVAADKLAVEYVGAGQGLIAIVEARSVQGKSVKVVSINGTLPGGDGYALRR